MKKPYAVLQYKKIMKFMKGTDRADQYLIITQL